MTTDRPAFPSLPVVKHPDSGLCERPTFLTLLHQLTRQAARYQSPFSLLLVRISGADRAAPPALLFTQCAQAIHYATRDVDLATALTATDLAVALPETSCLAAQRLAERILRALTPLAASARYTVAIGVADMRSARRQPDQLLTVAAEAATRAESASPPIVVWTDTAAQTITEWQAQQERATVLHRDIAQLARTAQQEYCDRVLALTQHFPTYCTTVAPHAERVAHWTDRLAEKLGWRNHDRTTLRRGALLHDIGLAVISERLLTQPGPLATPDVTALRAHPLAGVQLLEPCAFLREELATILHHHERYDGSGYPDHLAGTHIPMGARIVGLAEAWDAMTAPHPYRTPLSVSDAACELSAKAGTQFDPELVQVFLPMVA